MITLDELEDKGYDVANMLDAELCALGYYPEPEEAPEYVPSAEEIQYQVDSLYDDARLENLEYDIQVLKAIISKI